MRGDTYQLRRITVVALAIAPCEGDVDVERGINLLNSKEDLLKWEGERGPVGSKTAFTRQTAVSGIISEIKEITSKVSEPYTVLLETQGRSATFTVLVGHEAVEEWRRCVYRAETVVPVEVSFCSTKRRHLLDRRR